jgi:hypothetical protein
VSLSVKPNFLISVPGLPRGLSDIIKFCIVKSI